MSAHACPVCEAAKAEAWHLVCRSCWSTVPAQQQDRLFTLYKKERGSDTHRELCRLILRALHKARRDTQAPRAVATLRRARS